MPSQNHHKPFTKDALVDTGALVLSDDFLFGAVPMEDMDILISFSHRKDIVNPDSPNFPQALVK